MLPHITSMEIDEAKLNIPSNYTQVRRGGRVVDSDHVPIEMNLDLKILPTHPIRSTIYNFKSQQGRDTFKKLTSETNDFSKCFQSTQSLQVQSELWKQTLESYCQKSFSRIRLKKRKTKLSSADNLIKERNILKKKQEENQTDQLEDLKINELEETIADILAREEMSKINQLKQFSATHGSICINEMWKLKQKLWPKKSDTIPTGKINHQGKLVTAPDDIKKLLEKEYRERLRPRPNHPNLTNIKELKKKDFEVKLEQAKKNKSPDWTMVELEQVLNKIDMNKSRDPYGLNRSLFHIDYIGSDLKQSLLILFNKVKKEGQIPEFMKKALISTIPKPGSKFLLKNERGIFVLSAVRNILMRLLYNTNYEVIDDNMSDSNVGGRKKRSCLNHIFIINGIIHETLSSKKNHPVTIQIYDYKQIFDSMDLEEAVSDLYDTGVKKYSLSLLYEANKDIKVQVKTPYGLSAETCFKKIVLQGDTWGPTMAANQVDTFGKQLLEEEPDYIYKYKGFIPIGVLGMIYDLAGVSESGQKAVQLNAFINVKTAEKNCSLDQRNVTH